MKRILNRIQSLAGFQSVLLESGAIQAQSLGLSRASRLAIAAAIAERSERPILLLTNKTDQALTLLEELALWLPGKECLFFPEPTSLFYENVAWGENTRRERILCLTKLASSLIPGLEKSNEHPFIVAPVRAMMSRIMPRQTFLRACKSLKLGQNINPVHLTKDLIAGGYEPTASVSIPGQFARRGGILDIWPPDEKKPTRIDFFGDQVESMRHFDPASQRTSNHHSKLLIPPAREFLVDPNQAPPDIETGWTEFYTPLLHPISASIMDYLPKSSLILVDDFQNFRDTINEHEEQAMQLRADYLSDGSIQEDHPLPYITQAEIEDTLTRFNVIELGPSSGLNESTLNQSFTPNQRFGGRLDQFVEFLKKLSARGDQLFVVSRQAARLNELWEQSLVDDPVDQPVFIHGSLSEGWLLSELGKSNLHLLTDGEIFGWKRPQPRHRVRYSSEAPESQYLEFQINDLIVHVDHGIGRYKGLVLRKIEGIEQEYVCIEYADGDQLYVPVHQADRISRYVGARGHRPGISRLSGTDWKTTKKRVQQAVQAVAEDLLTLYASRQVAKGFAFQTDTHWQKELEASFPYIETDDQLKVLAEVKADMERARPMDRLICGDVGYGKTEVALRAAFKAVNNGKQVAILVPTTVLAQQHFRTFRHRLAAFPVKVEMLSRFRTIGEQRQIVHELALGKVDIIIGTHRLVQSDIQFKDLGLVVIDEEQRFGVTHKEYLKQLRTEVDVLTMTATPIPRTLYMTLTGVRDISTINTPPEERLPIVTHVGAYAPKLVRQAITRELERGGQVFFVHNRVQTIESFKINLQNLVPEARIAVAHGQMHEKQLATRMRDFSNGDVDVLLSTSIIESGLDIPNANTLIVDRADTFGLAQLYQLRGRVGRGALRAYAYFFTHGNRTSTEESKLRLETLAENTQLGAGFSIAMRDLEIRGAGDFLGTRQHGYIAAVGLNLYTRLLSQAVETIKKNGKLSDEMLTTSLVSFHPFINIDLPFAASIPEQYIREKELRLKLYRRLADIFDQAAVAEIRQEFEDRFGKLPEEVENLLYQVEIKIIAEAVGLRAISGEGKQILIRFPILSGGKKYQFPPFDRNLIVGKNTIRFKIEKSTNWQSTLKNCLNELLAYYQANPKIK